MTSMFDEHILRLVLIGSCAVPFGCSSAIGTGSSTNTGGASGLGGALSSGGASSAGASSTLSGAGSGGFSGSRDEVGGAGGLAGATTGNGGLGGAAGASGSANAGGANAGGANAGAGGASTGGSAGSGGSSGMAPNDDYLKTHTRDYGFVQIAAANDNRILSFSTTLAVPAKPTQNTGTLFLWPGLQPGGANFEPIDNGVLQPVLTWGPTCAPNAPKNGYASWWVSAQYVSTFGSDPGYTGCLGGDGMNVQVGDALQMVMTLNGTVWHQTVTDTASQQVVSYDIDMLGQAQNYAEFVIEIYMENPAADVVFTNNSITFANAEPAACQPTTRGMNDFFTNPRVSADGKVCTIDRVVLRAEGVAATSPN